MATIDELSVRITADTRPLAQGMQQAGRIVDNSARRMGGSLSALSASMRGLVPAVAVSALVGFSRNAINAAGALQDMADRLGVSVTFLNGLQRQAEAAGAGLQDIGQAFFFMNNAIGEASANLEGPMAQAFERLNLGVEQLKSLSPEEAFYLISQRIAEMGNAFERTEMLRNVFGRGVARLKPILEQGGEALKGHNDELERMGSLVTGEQIAALDEFGDAMTELGGRIRDGFISAMAEAVISVQRFTGEASAMGTTALRREIAEAEANIARAEGTPSAQRPRDRMGNVVDVAASERRRLERLRAELNAGQSEAFGPDLPAARSPAASSGAAKASKELTEAQKEQNAALEEGRRIYEDTRTPLENYIARVGRAKDLLGQSIIDQDTYNRYVREQSEIMDTELSRSLDNIADKSVQTTRIIKDSFGDALEDVMFDFENFGAGASSILLGLAKNLARSRLIDPLSSGVSDLIGDSGLLDGIGDFFGGFFADGGRPPLGKVSVVGEDGPELFVPDAAGTIVPNSQLGGGIVVNHAFHIQSGVTRQELSSMIPSIVAQSKAATFAAIERGGHEARAVGRK